jgi:ArsR family transcriptional regulator, arsenate/arsenite/antimonite-responsive transcriptional repressor
MRGSRAINAAPLLYILSMTKTSAPTSRPQSKEPAGRRSRLPERQFAAIAKALADPRRYGIVSEIASSSGGLPCCALRAAEAVSAATISHHIKSLEAAGLIEVVREGKFARLSFRRDTFDAYLRQLSDGLRSRG